MLNPLPIAIFKISDSSMEPGLHSGDFIVVNKWSKLGIGDIVVLRHPVAHDMLIVKRIRKMEDQRIQVFGDNVLHSEDSRHFGAVFKDSIIGKVILKVR